MVLQKEQNKTIELVAATGFADPDYPNNPFLIRVFKTEEDLSEHDGYNACISMMNWCMIPYKIIVDSILPQNLAHVCKGNLYLGFALVTPEDFVMQDCIKLARWIESKGMIIV